MDFLYTCETHLADPGFATALLAEESNPSISAEEIERVKKDWEAKQELKKSQEKQKEKEKEQEKEKEKETEKGGSKVQPKSPAKSPKASASPSGSSTPSHQRFALHRQIWAMRQSDHRKRRQVKETKEVAPKLPGVPRGALS